MNPRCDKLMDELNRKNRELLDSVKSAGNEYEMELIDISQKCGNDMLICGTEIEDLVHFTDLKKLALRTDCLCEQFDNIVEQAAMIMYFEDVLNVDCLYPKQEEIASVRSKLDNLVDSLGRLEQVNQEISSVRHIDIIKADIQEQLVKPIEECERIVGLASSPLLIAFITKTRDEIANLATLFTTLSQLTKLNPTFRNWACLRDSLGLHGLKSFGKRFAQ